MDRLKTLLLFVFLFSNQEKIIAQNSISTQEMKSFDNLINEKIYINCNTNVLITGETLYYKLYCLNKKSNTPSLVSKVSYVELFDKNNKSISKQKLFLESGISNGEFFIPSNLETGSYKLVGYTSWMLNGTNLNDHFETTIYIINSFEKTKPNKKESGLTTTKSLTNTENSFKNEVSFTNVNLTTDKTEYSKREKISLKIKSDILNLSNTSLSIRKKDSLTFGKNITSFEYLKNRDNKSTLKSIGTELILPELRGEIISGKIKSPKNSVSQKDVGLSFLGENHAFKISKTDNDGNFTFVLEKPITSTSLIVQVIDKNSVNYTIEVNETKSSLNNLESLEDIILDSKYKNIIEERSIASQIENAYFNSKKDSILSTKHNMNFYEAISKEYILDNYTRFPSLKETIVEIIEGMYFNKTKGNYSIHLKDYDEKIELEIPSLVLVDGLYITDVNELFQYNIKNVYKINIVKGGYVYGGKLFNGIVSFTTNDFDYESKQKGDFITKPEVIRPAPKKIYNHPDYSNSENLKRIPDYRYQLLWLPKLMANNNESEVNFYSSDLSGTFEIILDGFTNDGKPISVSKTFEVK